MPNFRNFRLMERFAPGGNFPEKVVHLQRSSSLSDLNVPLPFQKFAFPVPLRWEVVKISIETYLITWNFRDT